jgi:hypothetical protein
MWSGILIILGTSLFLGKLAKLRKATIILSSLSLSLPIRLSVCFVYVFSLPHERTGSPRKDFHEISYFNFCFRNLFEKINFHRNLTRIADTLHADFWVFMIKSGLVVSWVSLFVSVGVRTAACWLIVPPALDVPTLATRCPRAYWRVPHSSGGSWNLWAGIRTDNFA